jgi:hypothetical protein
MQLIFELFFEPKLGKNLNCIDRAIILFVFHLVLFSQKENIFQSIKKILVFFIIIIISSLLHDCNCVNVSMTLSVNIINKKFDLKIAK